MAEYKYYYPDGAEIKEGFDGFVKFYSKLYYYVNPDIRLERRIDRILKEGIESAEDIVDIFRWKIGATDYCYEPLVVYNQYHPKANPEKHTNGNPLKLDGVWEVVKSKAGKESCYEDAVRSILKKLLNNLNCVGIGPTYALTVIYFLTGGKYPIYDKFAYIALKKICESKEDTLFDKEGYLQTELFKDTSLPNKIIFDGYNEFKTLLENWLDAELGKRGMEEYCKSRDIDRALWTYGHLFNKNKRNEKRRENE